MLSYSSGMCFAALFVIYSTSAGKAFADSIDFSVAAVSSPQVVFDTRTQACEKIDIPDASARAFRDSVGQIHLIASHFVTRAMVGPTLDAVRQDCKIVYKSAEDGDPSQFMDYNWMGSFFTKDGKLIAALLHDEYHGWAYPKMCETAAAGLAGHCWYNTIGFATSADGGRSFQSEKAPSNLVASMPFPYDSFNSQGAIGYYSPSNIVLDNNYFYAMINAWSNTIQKHGACLIRTTNVFAPTTWRGWDGHGFDVIFIDPFLTKATRLEDHICQPVYAGTVQSLVYDASSHAYFVSEWTPDNRYGPSGFYMAASKDLIHWGRPHLIKSAAAFEKDSGPGRWRFDYFSLIDPSSPDRDFSTVADHPYVYYVRFDLKNGPYERILFRERLLLRTATSPP